MRVISSKIFCFYEYYWVITQDIKTFKNFTYKIITMLKLLETMSVFFMRHLFVIVSRSRLFIETVTTRSTSWRIFWNFPILTTLLMQQKKKTLVLYWQVNPVGRMNIIFFWLPVWLSPPSIILIFLKIHTALLDHLWKMYHFLPQI